MNFLIAAAPQRPPITLQSDWRTWRILSWAGRLLLAALIVAAFLTPDLALSAEGQMVRRLRIMKSCENCDLSGVDLARYGLARANLNGADLRGANLRGADLTRAQLRGAVLDRADLRETKLEGADLRGARLVGARLDGANLERARMDRAQVIRCSLRDASVQRADFTRVNLDGTDLRGTDVTKIRLNTAILRNVNLSGADLENVFLREVDLSGANLSGAILDRADLQKARLSGANLAGATMENASLISATMQNADLRKARLAGARMRSADLTGADLSEALLDEADLTGALLVKARLAGAALANARLNNANLAAADLKRVNLDGASASGVMMVGADLSSADLTKTDFSGANLGAANLAEARLTDTSFRRADLRFAKFGAATIKGANFNEADLRGAKIDIAQLDDADINGAKIDRTLEAALKKSAPADKTKDEDAAEAPAGAQKAENRDPLPAPIRKAELAVEIADVVRTPPSNGERPLARINWLTHAGDGSGRLFVVDMRGKIYVIKGGRLLPEPFLDIAAIRGAHFFSQDDLNETGLSSIAFHPDFARRGRPGYGKLYTVHTERPDAPAGASRPRVFNSPIQQVRHQDVLSEWQVEPNEPDRVDPDSQREILRVRQPHHWHNIGLIAFNPNAKPSSADYGMLYVASGDGGDTRYAGALDFHRLAQNPANLYASIMRINPLADGRFPYSVPMDNPFIGKPGHLPEIWAYGFRNPQRFSWDRGGSGKMIVTDVGQALIEELNIGVAGANYGWSEREGTFVVDRKNEKNFWPLPPNDQRRGYTYPVAQYDHSEGAAVSGGFVYRGSAIRKLRGMYVFGDLVRGRIFYVPVDDLRFGRQATIHELTLYHRGEPKTLLEILGGDSRADLRFGVDETGEIYALTKRDGMVRMLRPAPERHTAR